MVGMDKRLKDEGNREVRYFCFSSLLWIACLAVRGLNPLHGFSCHRTSQPIQGSCLLGSSAGQGLRAPSLLCPSIPSVGVASSCGHLWDTAPSPVWFLSYSTTHLINFPALYFLCHKSLKLFIFAWLHPDY